MIYTVSDLHGVEPEVLQSLLNTAGFCDDDELYVLGDVIDRGEHGIELLQWMMTQPNVELLLGNHEAMLLSCSFIFEDVTNEFLVSLSEEMLGRLSSWMNNGGDTTIKALKQLKDKSPEALSDVLDYVRDAYLWAAVTAGDKDFILTHSGFDNFSPYKKMSEYTSEELLWNRPELNDSYFDDIITVFGHTPTGYIDASCKGRILRTPTWIDIDAGAGSGYPPCLLRLDDLKEFYL